MSDRGLAIIDDDTLSEINDPTYEPSSASDDYSSSDYDTDGICYYCSAELEYEENEYYDPEADRFYCKRCFEQIHEH